MTGLDLRRRSPAWNAMVVIAMVTAVAGQAPSGVAGGIREVTVVRGDTLRGIGSRHGSDPWVLAADNHILTTATLAVGQQLRVDTRHIVPRSVVPGTIVVNVPQRMLFFHDGRSLRAWPVAVGRRDWPTPLGAFTVLVKEEHPTWDVPVSILEEARRAGRPLPASVPPGPANPLGDHWIGLSLDGVGIHGTNAPASIYQLVTHGCIRLHPDDVAELFAGVRVRITGTVIYEPVLVTREGEAILLEVHPDLYRRGPTNPLDYVRIQIEGLGTAADIDWARVTAVIAERAGTPRIVSRPSGVVDPGD